MTPKDKAYLIRRAETQLEYAQASHNARAVNAHYSLAESYLERAYGTEEGSVRAPDPGANQLSALEPTP